MKIGELREETNYITVLLLLLLTYVNRENRF